MPQTEAGAGGEGLAGNVLDRFYAALCAGDLAAACACLTPDARIWHSFDGVAQGLDASRQAWADLIAGTRERAIADVRRQPIAGGFLQQHMFIVTTAGGERFGWPCCLVVRTQGDRVARIDEYMDRAGALAMDRGSLITPGL